MYDVTDNIMMDLTMLTNSCKDLRYTHKQLCT